MSINEDYKEIISNNRKYVTTNFPKFFNEYYLSYKIKLAKNIDLNVFDEQDRFEVKGYLKELYKKTLKETIYTGQGEINGFMFDWISLNNGLIEVDKLQMLESSKEVWNTYDAIEEVLEYMVPFTHSVFLGHCRFTIRIKAIKEYSINLKDKSSGEYGIFKKNGYECFLYFEKHFNNQKGITIKYTMIFEFLVIKNLILNNFDQYRVFVVENRNEFLNGTKFARRADTHEKSTSYLTDLYYKFNIIQ